MRLRLKIRTRVSHEGTVLYHYHYPSRNAVRHPITDEANALVLDEKANIISYTFKRILDLADPYSDVIDWTKEPQAELQEPGVFVKFDKYKGKLLITTKNGIGGKEHLPGTKRELATAIHTVLYSKYKTGEPTGMFFEDFSYVCQFVYPEPDNYYKYPDFVLLAVMDKQNCREMSREFCTQFANANNLQIPINTSIKNVGQVVKCVRALNNSSRGVVVVDREHNRVVYRNSSRLKPIKSSGHVDMYALADVVLTGKYEHFLYYFPSYEPMIRLMLEALDVAKERLQTIWSRNKHLSAEDFNTLVKPQMLARILRSRMAGEIQSFDNLHRLIDASLLILLTANSFTKKYEKTYKLLREEVTQHAN